MKHGGKMLVVLATVFVLSTSVQGTAPGPAGNPYTLIAKTNLFRLKLPTPPHPPVPPLPKIIVGGITSILGRRQVLVKIMWAPNQVTSYVLSEGERVKEIEVLEIIEKAASVRFNNNGTEQVISLSTEVTADTMPPVAPKPGVAPTVQPAQKQMLHYEDAEEQIILMELERERLKGEGDSISLLIPPTSLTPQ